MCPFSMVLMIFNWFVFLDKQKNEHEKLRIYEEITQPQLAFTREGFNIFNQSLLSVTP